MCSIRQAGKFLENFKFQNYDIECVSNYKYLGIHFTASGSFHFAQTELYKKPLKAYFKLRKDFFSLNPSVKSSMHIFDHTLKPILLYNSEVWGSYNISSDRLNTRVFDLDNTFKSLQCEKLLLKFSKVLLGLHKKSVNFAVLSELGRSPLHFNIVISLVKYWYRLVNLSNESKLLHDAYI